MVGPVDDIYVLIVFLERKWLCDDTKLGLCNGWQSRGIDHLLVEEIDGKVKIKNEASERMAPALTWP